MDIKYTLYWSQPFDNLISSLNFISLVNCNYNALGTSAWFYLFLNYHNQWITEHLILTNQFVEYVSATSS